MEIRILLLFEIIIQWKCCYSVSLLTSISSEISDDVTFIHKTFPVPPSKRAIIEVDVSYPKNASYFPKLGIYTTQDHTNIRNRCQVSEFGQFGNGNLHPGITVQPREWTGPLTCRIDNTTNTIHCSGNITIQDFKPRNLTFSFGFKCKIVWRYIVSLRGLLYKMRIHVTNETECVQLPTNHTCYRYVQHGMIPNLSGRTELSSHQRIRYSYTRYQHSHEYLCCQIFPRCDPVTNQIVPPCREMCLDYGRRRYCNYLPSLNGDVLCFYEPVKCRSPPPSVTYGRKNINYTGESLERPEYFAGHKVVYSCYYETILEGKKFVTCKLNGQWTTPPRCVKKPKANILPVVLPSLLVLLVVMLLIGACIYRKRRKKKWASVEITRRKQYDAFVCYCYEGRQDADFAEKIAPQELEEEHSLKLCIHRRDFKAGWDIKWNIMNAIRNSNSAIIIMSQDYINSLWCVEEFEDCYMENMKDQAFKLFVILMQPVDTLNITNDYIQSFFTKKTYLERDDPKLFQKIAEYLIQVKQIQKAPEGATREAIDALLENRAQNEAEENNGLIIEENIELQILNHQIDVNLDHLTEDEESGDELLEKRDTDTILEDDENHERMELRVEVHSGNVADTGDETLKIHYGL